MRALIVGLVIILVALQYELWFSKNGVRQYFALKEEIALQQQDNNQLAQRNQAIAAEVKNLKQSQESIEEHARNDLGMIKKDETFYQVVKP